MLVTIGLMRLTKQSANLSVHFRWGSKIGIRRLGNRSSLRLATPLRLDFQRFVRFIPPLALPVLTSSSH